MHSIGKVILEAAVSTLVKEGVSAVVRGVTSKMTSKLNRVKALSKIPSVNVRFQIKTGWIR